MSPLSGNLLKILFGINGIEKGRECLEKPYDHFETNIKSPTNKLVFIDPEGMLKGSAINDLINKAIIIAYTIDLTLLIKLLAILQNQYYLNYL